MRDSMLGQRRRSGEPASLLLRNLEWYSAGETYRGDLRLAGGRIVELGDRLTVRAGDRALELDGHLAFPGLINAHDHLDLNLLPRLGQPPYDSFYAWAEDIYRPHEPPVNAHRRVALRDRLWWGAYRNLVSGVTTVMHHDPYHCRVFDNGFPLRVARPYRWAHSLGYGQDPRRAYAAGQGPFVIHAAEGTDDRAAGEIDQLEAMGLLQQDTIIVHGIAVSPRQWQQLADRGVALVWCPASNLHLYGRTVAIDMLPDSVVVALGTDSTLSGSPGLLDELRAARDTGLVAPARLLQMVTTAPAAMLALQSGAGQIQQGCPADLLLLAADAAAGTGSSAGAGAVDRLLEAGSDALALVAVGGKIALANPAIAGALELGTPNALIDGQPKWLAGDLGALRRRIVRSSGGNDEVWASNPLWERLRGTPR